MESSNIIGTNTGVQYIYIFILNSIKLKKKYLYLYLNPLGVFVKYIFIIV
jgi:hypothetical protein